MKEKEVYEHIGETNATLKAMSKTLEGVSASIQCFTKFQARTEQRLNNGVKHFEKVDTTLEEHDDKISGLPRGPVVYAIITIGFIVVGILVTIIGLQ